MRHFAFSSSLSRARDFNGSSGNTSQQDYGNRRFPSTLTTDVEALISHRFLARSLRFWHLILRVMAWDMRWLLYYILTGWLSPRLQAFPFVSYTPVYFRHRFDWPVRRLMTWARYSFCMSPTGKFPSDFGDNPFKHDSSLSYPLLLIKLKFYEISSIPM